MPTLQVRRYVASAATSSSKELKRARERSQGGEGRGLREREEGEGRGAAWRGGGRGEVATLLQRGEGAATREGRGKLTQCRLSGEEEVGQRVGEWNETLSCLFILNGILGLCWA